MRKVTALMLAGIAGCASPPSSNPSIVEASCAQQCSSSLATCSGGFKLFPIVQQKQCNDNYDVCIHGCPPRAGNGNSVADRLRSLDELRTSGALTDAEYAARRKAIIDSL